MFLKKKNEIRETSPAVAPGEPSLSLFSISWPIFIDILLHFATMLINMLMAGMVSVEAVAELTVGTQVFNLGMILFNFFNIGVCVVCAQALGNGNKSMARRVIHMGLGLNLIWGSVVSLGIFFSADLIVALMQVPAGIALSSQYYMMIIALGLLPEALCLCCAQILRAYGCTKDSMYVSVLINVVTVLGNCMFLFGFLGAPVLGVTGVAISTAAARFIAVFLLLYLVILRTRVRIVPCFMFVFKKKILLHMLDIGLPGAGENLSWHLQYMCMTAVVASLGAVPLAAHGIYQQLCMIMVIFSTSLGMGTEIIIAHYAGAMKLLCAYRQLLRSVKIGFFITASIAITIPLGTGKLFFSFFTDNYEVLQLVAPIFLLSVLMEPGRIFNVIIINSLRAVGDTRFPVIMAVISMWGISVMVGMTLGLHFGLGLLGVWIGFCCDEWARGIAMFLRWISRAWVKAARRNYRKNFLKARSHKLPARTEVPSGSRRACAC